MVVPRRPARASHQRFHLTKRLRDLDLSPAQSRSTALFELATELPAAILARLLGIHISVAAAWQRASAGDWTTDAADVSRRQNREPNPMKRAEEVEAHLPAPEKFECGSTVTSEGSRP